MDPKLTILFLLIGSIIGLSHLNDDNLARMRRQLIVRRLARIRARAAQILGKRPRVQVSVIPSVPPPRSTASAAADGLPWLSLRMRPG